MKKLINFLISLSIGVGLLIWIIRLVGWQEIKSAFSIFTGWQGLVILSLTFLMLLVGALRWQLILRSQGQKLSIKQLIGPYLGCYALNYLFQIFIVGGEIFRIYVLKEKYNVAWRKAAGSVAIDKVLEMTAFVVTILVGLSFFLVKIGLPPRNLAILLLAFVVFLVGSVGFFYFRSFKRQSIARPITKFFARWGLPQEEILDIERETFNYFKIKKAAFWQGLVLALLKAAVTGLRAWVLVLFLGKTIGIFAALPILSFVYIATLVPIPADLGIHETIQFFAFDALGLETGTALAFTTIQRGAQLMMAFIGILIMIKLSLSLLQTIFFKKLNGLLNGKNA